MSGIFRCDYDWIVDGKVYCIAGKEYTIRDAQELEGEDAEGYCDILDCENGAILETNWVEVGEHFDEDSEH